MLLKNNCELCFAFADPKACIFHNKHFSSQNFWCFCCFSFVLSSDYWYVCCAWPNAFVPLRTIAHHWQMNKSQQHLNARETVALIFIFFFIKTSAILCMGRQIMQSSSSSVMWLGCGSVCGICSMQQQHKKNNIGEQRAISSPCARETNAKLRQTTMTTTTTTATATKNNRQLFFIQ